jgi:hypothetical protein
MKPISNKKHRERVVVEFIYDANQFWRLEESERPDFVVQHSASSQPFGVEVTEYYMSEPHARLKNVPQYFSNLLDGGRPIHRDDINALRPEDIEILASAGSSAGTVKGIITPLPSLADHVAAICERILEKGAKWRGYQCDLSHINLILYDRSSRLALSNPEECHSVLFTTDAKATLAATPFREVFYVTSMGRDESRPVIIPLRQVLLVSELFFFNGAYRECADVERSVTPAGQLSLFAAFMQSRGVPVDAIVDERFGIEIRLGNTGVVVSDTWDVRILDYCDAPRHGEHATSADLRVLGGKFEKCYEGFVANNMFSSGLARRPCA